MTADDRRVVAAPGSAQRPLGRLSLPAFGVWTLRARLVVVLAVVIVLSLSLAGATFIVQVREYGRQQRLDRLISLASPLAMQVRVLETAGASPTDIMTFLDEHAQDVGVRVLLLDREGLVLEDTDGVLADRNVRLDLAGATRRRRGVIVGSHRQSGQPTFSFVAVSTPSARPSGPGDRFVARGGSYVVAVAMTEQSLAEAWLDLLPSLAVAGLIALVLSTGVAIFFARSISRPVAAMTRAAQEIARGRYDQTIDARGHDEIASLARSFNAMARAVGQSDRTLRDFLANASHDLKTPLTTIQGFSLAMTDGTLRTPDDYADAGQAIHEEANRMRRLVDDLLYLSRLESRQARMEFSPFDLSPLVRSQRRRVERHLSIGEIRLEVDLPEALTIVGDPRELEKLVANLLDNALRYTPPGGTITLAVLPGPRATTIRVHNTGSYVAPSERSQIFERFYQADTSRADEGSGLGLAIVREIVSAHGGAIEVRSDPTTGTEFVVTLPHLTPA